MKIDRIELITSALIQEHNADLQAIQKTWRQVGLFHNPVTGKNEIQYDTGAGTYLKTTQSDGSARLTRVGIDNDLGTSI